MPDFERVLRSFSMYVADDRRSKELEWYYRGQDDARKEIAVVFGIAVTLVIIVAVVVIG